jgi:hypothetical protein
VIDGDNSYANGKRWRTNSFPAWVEITFDGEKTLDQLRIYGQLNDGSTLVTPTKEIVGTMALKTFTLSYWVKDAAYDDGGYWEEIKTITDNDKVRNDVKLEQEITTSKIRLDLPEASKSAGYARVMEIEAWGYTSEE